MLYPVTCKCGGKTTVKGTNAGTTIRCQHCGASLNVPPLSVLREHEKQEPPAPPTKSRRDVAKAQAKLSKTVTVRFVEDVDDQGMILVADLPRSSLEQMMAEGTIERLDNGFYIKKTLDPQNRTPPKPLQTKQCQSCGKGFSSANEEARYCSDECRMPHNIEAMQQIRDTLLDAFNISVHSFEDFDDKELHGLRNDLQACIDDTIIYVDGLTEELKQE